MQISENLIRRIAQYLEANAKDPTGQALLKQLRFVLEVNLPLTPMEGGKYLVNRGSGPKVQGQSTVKLRDFLNTKPSQVGLGRFAKSKKAQPQLSLSQTGW